MKWIIVAVMLIGICFASLSCFGDNQPNLNMPLYLNCTAEVESKCYADIYDTVGGNLVRYYPTTAFGEDKIGWNTFPDGKFIAEMYIDDGHFAYNRSYTVEVNCYGVDNASQIETFEFNTFNYKQPDFLSNWVMWCMSNKEYIFGSVVIVVVLIVLLRWRNVI